MLAALGSAASAHDASASISGSLHRLKGNSLFKAWSQRYVELRGNVLSFYILNGGVKTGELELGLNTLFAESSLRHFCFSLTNSSTGEVQYFAADNMALKEAWSEKVQLALMEKKLLYQRHLYSTTTSDRSTSLQDELASQYQSRPLLYIKVIQARNLADADSNGKSDPYVIVNVGPSSVRTITRKKTVNPEWGMVFHFDWDRSYRYAKIEVWDDDFGGNDDFLGVVFIPLLPMRNGFNQVAWYPMGKKSTRNIVRGEIQIEISCSGDPDPDHLTWHFYRELRQLPELSVRLDKLAAGDFIIGGASSSSSNLPAPSSSSSTSSPAVQMGGFPAYFPPIEAEVLEDFSMRVQLQCQGYGSKVSCKGVLLLTNFRLVFVAYARLLSSCRLPSTQLSLAGVLGSNPIDFTTQVPLGSVLSVSLTTETDGANNTIDVLRVKTADHRLLNFLFRDDLEFMSKGSTRMSVDHSHSQTQGLSSGNVAGASSYTASGAAGGGFPSFGGDSSQKSQSTQSSHLVGDDAVDLLGGSRHYLQQLESAVWHNDGDRFTDDDTTTAADGTHTNLHNNSNANSSTHELVVSKRNLKIISARRSVVPVVGPLSAHGVEAGPSDIEKAWLQLTRFSSFLVDAGDSPDGPPCHRIFIRVHYENKNRTLVRKYYGELMKELLTAIYDQQNAWLLRNPGGSKRGFLPKSASSTSTSSADNDDGTNPTLPPPSNKSNGSSDGLFSSDNNNSGTGDDIEPARLPLGWSSEQDENQLPKTASQVIEYNCSLAAFKQNAKVLSLPACYHIKRLISEAWSLYDPLKELERMSIPDWLWRVSTVNEHYEMSPTYPALLAVPMNIDDDALRGSAQFRSRGRIPALCWRNVFNNCTLSRCSQPHVGLSQHRSVHDERLINEINRSGGQYAFNRYNLSDNGGMSPSSHLSSSMSGPGSQPLGKPYIIVDARPLLNATANQAAGKGFESEKNYENTSVIFMDIANIHAVRKSLEQVDEACVVQERDESNWLKNLDASGWLTHIRKILLACTRIVRFLAYEDLSVLVHCSDGWDRTSQLTSLTMLMLDPYYRTIKGFIVLVEKEWISFGHKFADRLGWTRYCWKDEERSPVFLQFLDCVHQCLAQRQHAFEFTEDLLCFIADGMHSGWFGTFAHNCEKELKESQPFAVSLWTVVLNFPEKFTNYSYKAVEEPVVPVATKARVVFWHRWFMRWHDRVWHAAWTQESQTSSSDADYEDGLLMSSGNSGFSGKVNLDGTANSGSSARMEHAGAGNGAMDGSHSHSGTEWADDKTARGCKRCAKTFNFVRRRHHCRSCGQIYCESCANEHRVVAKISQWRMSRVCLDCANKIDNSQQQQHVAAEAARVKAAEDAVAAASLSTPTAYNSEFFSSRGSISDSISAGDGRSAIAAEVVRSRVSSIGDAQPATIESSSGSSGSIGSSGKQNAAVGDASLPPVPVSVMGAAGSVPTAYSMQPTAPSSLDSQRLVASQPKQMAPSLSLARPTQPQQPSLSAPMATSAGTSTGVVTSNTSVNSNTNTNTNINTNTNADSNRLDECSPPPSPATHLHGN